MHPVILQQLAAERVSYMIAKAEDWHLARQARLAPAVTNIQAKDAARPATHAGRNRTTVREHRRPCRPGRGHARAIG